MMSKPVWSWLDAVVIGALLLAGTSAMVEARNRVVIDPPEVADIAEVVQAAPAAATKLCSITSQTGEVMFMPYAGPANAALAAQSGMSCPD